MNYLNGLEGFDHDYRSRLNNPGGLDLYGSDVDLRMRVNKELSDKYDPLDINEAALLHRDNSSRFEMVPRSSPYEGYHNEPSMNNLQLLRRELHNAVSNNSIILFLFMMMSILSLVQFFQIQSMNNTMKSIMMGHLFASNKSIGS